MGLLSDYITDRHNNQLSQQKSVLDFYANAAGGDNPDPEVNHLALERHMKYSGTAPKKFNDPKVLQQMMDDNKLFEEMNTKARGQRQAPPPTQSLASQGPPSAQAMQVPPPPNGGGNNYGQFAGQPSAVMGQMVAPQQPASEAMGAIAPPPQSMQVPPPPPQGVDTSAVSSFRDISPTRALDRKGITDAEMKYGAQYGALYGATAKSKEQELAFQLKAQRAEIDQRIEDLKADKDETGKSAWDKLTARQRSEIRIGAKQVTPELRPMSVPGSVSNKDILAVDPTANINGVPLDPAGYSRQRIGPLGMEYSPGLPPVMGVGSNAEGGRELFNNRGPAGVIPGIVAPNMATPRSYDLVGGGKGIASAAQIAAGGAPTPVPGTIGAGTPSTSVTNIPGQLPQTTTRTKGGMAAPVTRGTPQTTKGPGIPDNSLIGRKYQDWVGGGPAPTGKELTAVQAYAANKNLPSPIQLSGAGQANLQSVDAVFREIDDADRILNKMKMDASLRGDYLKYKLGLHTPNDELFTKLSFEGLRSAAAAMKGNNSRAYPIIQRAFQHVPNLDRAGGLMPDQIPLIKDKLKAMRDVLTDTRNTVLQDERKSGVVPPPPGSSGTVNMKAPNGQVSPVPADQVEHYKSLGATVVQ